MDGARHWAEPGALANLPAGRCGAEWPARRADKTTTTETLLTAIRQAREALSASEDATALALVEKAARSALLVIMGTAGVGAAHGAEVLDAALASGWSLNDTLNVLAAEGRDPFAT